MSDQANSAAETTENLQLNINRILEILPHRYPLLLIDRVTHITRAKRIVAIKNVTINEPFFQGHFPEYAIMPGVLVVEAIAQAGGVLLLPEVPDHQNKLMVFSGIDRARKGRSVADRASRYAPGDRDRSRSWWPGQRHAMGWCE